MVRCSVEHAANCQWMAGGGSLGKEFFQTIDANKRLRIRINHRTGYYHVGLKVLVEVNGEVRWCVVRSHDACDGKGCHLHRHFPDGTKDERKLPDLVLPEAIEQARIDLMDKAERECERYLNALRQYQEVEGL